VLLNGYRRSQADECAVGGDHLGVGFEFADRQEGVVVLDGGAVFVGDLEVAAAENFCFVFFVVAERTVTDEEA